MSPTLYRVSLCVVVAVDLAVTWIHPSADPPTGYSGDNSLSVDGYWYLADARGSVEGTEVHVEDAYRRPLITAPARLIYGIAGVGLASSRGLSSLASVMTVLLVAALARRWFGRGLALLAAGLLASHPGWHVFVRSAVIYPWVAFWFLVVLWLASGTGWFRWTAAVAALVGLLVTLKSILILLAPALAVEGARRLLATRHGRSPFLWGAVALVTVAGGLAVPWLFPDFWSRIAYYTGGHGISPWSNLLALEDRSRLFSAAPLLVAGSFAALVLRARNKGAEPPEASAFLRSAHLGLWPALGVFAMAGYSPLRYVLPLFPLMVLLTVGAVHAVSSRGPERGNRRTDSARGVAIGIGLALLAVYAVLQYGRSAMHPGVPCALPGAVVGVGLAGALVAPALLGRRRSRLALPLLLAAALCLAVPRWIPILARPEFTLLSANRQLASAVPGESRIVGPFAHALTVENGLHAEQVQHLFFGEGRLREVVESRAWTHLLCDRPAGGDITGIFAADGVALETVAEFHVRGTEVVLLRFRDADLPRSPYEIGRRRMIEGRLDGAETAFLASLEHFPGSALAWSGLGAIELARGRPARAHRAFEEALRHDPWRLDAHLALARLYARNGYPIEAARHIRATRALAPFDAVLQGELDRLAASLRSSVEG